jgi:Plasmid pRiA4b ORF-3-like protein
MPRLYDLDVEFVGITPRIWRRVRVPAELALLDLHHVIQLVMDWRDYHLHLFEVSGKEYAPPPDEETEHEETAGDDADISVAQALA